VHILEAPLIILSVLYVSVFEDTLGLCDGAEELVTLRVKGCHVVEPLVLGGVLLVSYVVKLYEVFWQHEGVVKDEPKALLLVILLASEDGGDVGVILLVNWGISPDLRWCMARVKVGRVDVRDTLC